MAQTVKNLPAMWETQVQSLDLEDPRRREWVLSPVFLPGESHRQRSLVDCGPQGCKRVRHDLARLSKKFQTGVQIEEDEGSREERKHTNR